MLTVKRLTRKKLEAGQIVYPKTNKIFIYFSEKLLPKEVYIYGLPMKNISYVRPVIQCQNYSLYSRTALWGKKL